MTEPSIPEINVEEIMKKIREEVSRRKAQRNEGQQNAVMQQEVTNPFINPTVKQTRLWRAIKAIQFKLRRYPFYGFVYRTALIFTRFIPKYQTPLTIEEFLKYDGEKFIKNAYKGILLREADEQGVNLYLSQLRTGKLNKVQVLASLRYSKEGKEKRINIPGLFVPYIATKLYRIPILGYAIRWTTAIIKMPLIIRNITAFENYTNTRFNHLGEQLNNEVKHLSHKIEHKADAQAVQQLSDELEKKADAQKVQTDINNIIQQIRDQKLKYTIPAKKPFFLTGTVESEGVRSSYHQRAKRLKRRTCTSIRCPVCFV